MKSERESAKILSVVVPTYNERENIDVFLEKVTRELRKSKVPYEILIVDDNSPDKTYEKVKKWQKKDRRIRLIMRYKNPGFGISIWEGMNKARGTVIVPMMADMSDSPKHLVDLYKKMIEGDYDLVLTDRFKRGKNMHYPLFKKMSNRAVNTFAHFFNKMIMHVLPPFESICKNMHYPLFKKMSNRAVNTFVALTFRIPYYDLTNAFKAYNKRLVKRFNVKSKSFETMVELAVKGYLNSRKTTEIPVTWNGRFKGKSKFYATKLVKPYTVVILDLWKYAAEKRKEKQREKREPENSAGK